MVNIQDIFPFLIVALFWGVTNPFIEKSVKQKEDEFDPYDFSIKGIFKIIKRQSFVIAFGLNQIGSLLYAYLLGLYPQHFSSIAANSLTTAITFITESIVKKKKISGKKLIGLVLIIFGICLIF